MFIDSDHSLLTPNLICAFRYSANVYRNPNGCQECTGYQKNWLSSCNIGMWPWCLEGILETEQFITSKCWKRLRGTQIWTRSREAELESRAGITGLLPSLFWANDSASLFSTGRTLWNNRNPSKHSYKKCLRRNWKSYIVLFVNTFFSGVTHVKHPLKDNDVFQTLGEKNWRKTYQWALWKDLRANPVCNCMLLVSRAHPESVLFQC